MEFQRVKFKIPIEKKSINNNNKKKTLAGTAQLKVWSPQEDVNQENAPLPQRRVKPHRAEATLSSTLRLSIENMCKTSEPGCAQLCHSGPRDRGLPPPPLPTPHWIEKHRRASAGHRNLQVLPRFPSGADSASNERFPGGESGAPAALRSVPVWDAAKG